MQKIVKKLLEKDNCKILFNFIVATVSIITVIILIKSWKLERESSRAFFVINPENIRFAPISDNECIFECTIKNVGKNIVRDFETKFIALVDYKDKTKPDIKISLPEIWAYDIPPDWPITFRIKIKLSDNDIQFPIFFILALKYEDVILDKEYSQLFYLERKIEDGKPLGHLNAVDKETAEKILKQSEPILDGFYP